MPPLRIILSEERTDRTMKELKKSGKTRRTARRDSANSGLAAVAALAKVSIATVSRALNQVSTVDPKLKKRVLKAANEVGYVPNTQARALVSGRSYLLGILISDITNPFFPELIDGFEKKAVELGYEVLIGSADDDFRQIDSCVQRMLQRKVDGVAIMTFGMEEPLIERLAAKGIPMTFIDEAPSETSAISIKIDYDAGINEAVQHLAVLGHRRIAFISGSSSIHSARERRTSFLRATKSIGLIPAPTHLVESDHTVEGGIRATEGLLSSAERPTAIVCSNDLTALGVMHAAFANGLRIPDDLSLIGFDDISISRHLLPPLTTVHLSRTELASVAIESLRDRIEGRLRPSRQMGPIVTKLVVRQSTAVPLGSLADLPGVNRLNPSRR